MPSRPSISTRCSDLTAAAEFDGQKFDGVDLFLFAPHVDIDSSKDDLKQLAKKVGRRTGHW